MVPGHADWLGCAGCTSLYIVTDKDLPRFAAIGSIDTDFAPKGSARIKLWFKDEEMLILRAAQIPRIMEGWNLTSYPAQVVHGRLAFQEPLPKISFTHCNHLIRLCAHSGGEAAPPY